MSYITSDQSAENSIQGYRFAAEVVKVNNELLVDIVTYANCVGEYSVQLHVFGYGNKMFDKLKDKDVSKRLQGCHSVYRNLHNLDKFITYLHILSPIAYLLPRNCGM